MYGLIYSLLLYHREGHSEGAVKVFPYYAQWIDISSIRYIGNTNNIMNARDWNYITIGV